MNYSWGGAYLEVIVYATQGKQQGSGQLVPDSGKGQNVMPGIYGDWRSFVVYP